MQKDDLVYTGRMLDTARKAKSKVLGKTRAEFDHAARRRPNAAISSATSC